MTSLGRFLRGAEARPNPRKRPGPAWLHEPLPAALPATPALVAAARDFALARWRERAAEYGAPPPDDLTGSCKFTSLFAALVFGGRLRGNKDHQFVELPDGARLDLNAGARDVRRLGTHAHTHERTFWANPEHRDAMRTCEARARAWAERFLAEAAR